MRMRYMGLRYTNTICRKSRRDVGKNKPYDEVLGAAQLIKCVKACKKRYKGV